MADADAHTEIISAESSRSRLVASDLVSVLAQIADLDPAGAPVLMPVPQSAYGRILTAELQRSGYDLRIGEYSQGSRYLSYSIKPGDYQAARSYVFQVTIGSIGVKREYALAQEQIFPVSSVFISGAAPQGLVVDEDIFATSTVFAVPLKPVLKNSADDDSTVVSSGELPATDFPPVSTAAKRLSDNETSAEGAPLVVAPKLNVYDTRRSNFQGLLGGYEDVRKEVLVFNNDSVVMGQRNRRITRELIRDFDENTDVFSVIGCSHGHSMIEDGNRKLALGRSSRVREELILSGINPGYVLDEGCWSKNHFDEVMPRRGVVLTLKRLRNSG